MTVAIRHEILDIVPELIAGTGRFKRQDQIEAYWIGFFNALTRECARRDYPFQLRILRN